LREVPSDATNLGEPRMMKPDQGRAEEMETAQERVPTHVSGAPFLGKRLTFAREVVPAPWVGEVHLSLL